MFSRQSAVTSRPSWESPLRFIPRPLILQILEKSRKSRADSELKQDVDNLFTLTASLKRASVSPDMEIHPEDGSINTSQAHAQEEEENPDQYGTACDNMFTHYHDLICGHTITTSITSPDIVHLLKAPCSSACVRYRYLKSTGLDMSCFSNISHVAFVCPACVEAYIRENYYAVDWQYRETGFVPSKYNETNIRVWTHRAVLRLVDSGLRMAQGTTGVFSIVMAEKYPALLKPEHFDPAFNPLVTADPPMVGGQGASWRYREGDPGRNRSRSPRREHDDEGLDEKAQIRKKYRQRSPVCRTLEDPVMDGLVERLYDTKIGLPKDDDSMVELLKGLGDIMTREKTGEELLHPDNGEVGVIDTEEEL